LPFLSPSQGASSAVHASMQEVHSYPLLAVPKFLQLLINLLQFSTPAFFSHAINLKVFLFQSLEFIVQLVVPRVQDEDLESQRRRRDDEVGQRDSLCEYGHDSKM